MPPVATRRRTLARIHVDCTVEEELAARLTGKPATLATILAHVDEAMVGTGLHGFLVRAAVKAEREGRHRSAVEAIEKARQRREWVSR